MPEKILVVDDMPVNVKLLADLLAVKGYAVVTAASGAEALEKIDKEQPSLVLLDVMMPGMSGYDACRRIRTNPGTAMLPVIMVTALDPTQERVKGIEAGDIFGTTDVYTVKLPLSGDSTPIVATTAAACSRPGEARRMAGSKIASMRPSNSFLRAIGSAMTGA